MRGNWNATDLRRSVSKTVAGLLVCLSACAVSAQRRAGGWGHPGAARPRIAPRPSSGQTPRVQPGNEAGDRNPAGARPSGRYPGEDPAGHLANWLNQHQGLSPQQQERLLHNDPNFDHLPPATQQRLMQQLHRLNQMPEAQRERRLARGAMIERMPPEEQMQVRQAGRRYMALPADRQAQVKSAFRTLRSVPLDQRDTVLNSARYRSLFSPDERGILSNLLRAEPYEPSRQFLP